MIRRKAAAHESGLNDLKDVQEKLLYLPLSGDGVFGSALAQQLKKRKEQNDQVSELLPEFAAHGQKRNAQERDRKRPYASAFGASYGTRNYQQRAQI